MTPAYPIPKDPRFLNLTGRRFGRLVVLSYAGKSPGGSNSRWRVMCDCGKETLSAGPKMTGGYTKSCGCLSHSLLAKHNTTHGMANRLPEYAIWKEMRHRCKNPRHKQFNEYGGRGIKVCDRWLNSFPTFLADLGRRPDKNVSLDRINNDGNYEPGNCRWATRAQQASNKRNNWLITHCGTTMTVSEWSRTLGIPFRLLYSRLYRGMSTSRAMTKCDLRSS